MLQVGKLYICEEYFLLLYPDQEAAVPPAGCAPSRAASAPGAVKSCAPPGSAAARAAYWSIRLGKPVLYTEKNIPILVLNSKEKFYEVLAGDRKGWIIYQDWLELKEIG
jgi:hypothetical protein